MTAVTEKELEAVSVAKRVTLADLEKRILVTHYFNAAQAINSAEGLNIGASSSLGRTTFAMLVLDNGFTVTGQSACASPQNFDTEIGKRIAREDAVSKLWALLGFELRTKLSLVEGAPPLCGWMETVGAKTYVGMKCLRATPMSRGDYNTLRGWILPEDEDEHEAGYLVEYTDGGEQNVDGFAGYVSWSPAHVFEASYEQMD